ncbi:GNAT family N-acetyltransferase [Rugamonas sp. CCM 8940]|uniref:GNAT family N-acetyltransferase n=1 Tax=Rugamonas sp. CCM 8940 TaxID=2765359 RepID=UPI0018F34306|nr:GNAT family N-acetyltransferase [Rugamonas sp. CCM 8940]MBJ7311112.1 GNAT family N-acetyltransferase [Rugamonas sp. CCM 8940]
MMIIRHTTEEDWATLKEIRLAALLDAPTAFGVSHASAAANSEAQWRERAATGYRVAFLLAYIDGVAVGLAGGGVSQAAEFNLIAMWVKPEHRGTAAAAGLVDGIKAHALAQGHRRVVLGVSPDNARAAAFYRKLGFAFLPEWEALDSHPHIQVQEMEWLADA